ncbi:MAG: cation:proton antiporter [Chloroflexota bacterium]
MKLLLYTVGFAGVGYLFAYFFQIENVHNSALYNLLVASLLAIGLYGSTYSINVQELRQNLRIVLSAVTIGVFLKILFIGTVLYLFQQNNISFLYGVIVAQIDPLSVAALVKDSRFSKKAKTILSAWSSFDDPMTVIASLYIATLVVGDGTGNATSVVGNTSSIQEYFMNLGSNLLFVLVIYLLYVGGRYAYAHWLSRPSQKQTRPTTIPSNSANHLLTYGLLLVSLFTSVAYSLMLGIASIGLFLRPPIEHVIQFITKISLYVSVFLLGILLIGGVQLYMGFFVAIATISAQIVVGFLLTFGLPLKDRFQLALAQQNGVTAITLALIFEPRYGSIVAVIAPAILFINLLHVVFNGLLDRFDAHLFQTEES